MKTLNEFLITIPDKKYQILNSEIKKTGKFIVVDQSNFVSGYTNDESKIFTDLPAILFGDHSTRFFYAEKPFAIGCDGMKIIKSKGNVNQLFLYYYLQAIYKGDGKYRRHFGDLKLLPATFPTLDEQNEIVKCLKPIDDLIELNNLINKKLDNTIDTIYKYWFIQFDFPDKNGKPYKTTGGDMVFSNEINRYIPNGWKVGNIINSNISHDIKSGVDIFEKKKYLPTANVINDSIIDGEWVDYLNRETRANMQPTKFSIWFAKLKNSIKHISIPQDCIWFVDQYILSTGFQGIQCNETSFAYIHSLINSDWFENNKNLLAHGATQEGVNNSDLEQIKFPIPPHGVLIEYSKIVNKIIQNKFDIIKENQQLMSLKKFILPLLMRKIS